MMTAKELAAKAKDIATNYKTAYMLGTFGWPATEDKIQRAVDANVTNAARTSWQKRARALNGQGFLFDCVCLIKAILWGWDGDLTAIYGGAKYTSNGVPDISADQMIRVCNDVSTDFSDIQIGEAVWCSGHIGVYIGDGLAVECTPSWSGDVQITAVGNIGAKAGYNTRKWTKRGKLPYVTYEAATKPVVTVTGKASTGSAADEKTIWDFLKGKGLNDYAIAGLMGNLYAESALKSNNLQNSYEKKLGYTDVTYTEAVDSGSYDNFVKDAAGYGLAQWTFWSRKQGLLEYARAAKKSIGDLQTQLEFLWKELQGSTKVMAVLKSAASIQQASDVVLTEFERPADMGDAVKAKRCSFGKTYYDKYATKKPSTTVGFVSNPGIKVGTLVRFTGDKHYASTNTAKSSPCKPGLARVTQFASRGQHPYHLIAVNGGGSNVYGWVNKADITTASNTHKVTAKVGLNVRRGPGTGYGVATVLACGTAVVVAEIKDGWAKLADGRGYVSAQYLAEV